MKYNLQFSFLTGFIMIRELGCTFKNITNMVRNIFLYLINKARKRSEKVGVHLLILTNCIFLRLREGTLLCYAFSWMVSYMFLFSSFQVQQRHTTVFKTKM